MWTGCKEKTMTRRSRPCQCYNYGLNKLALWQQVWWHSGYLLHNWIFMPNLCGIEELLCSILRKVSNVVSGLYVNVALRMLCLSQKWINLTIRRNYVNHRQLFHNWMLLLFWREANCNDDRNVLIASRWIPTALCKVLMQALHVSCHNTSLSLNEVSANMNSLDIVISFSFTHAYRHVM